MRLSSNFRNPTAVRSDEPLSDDQIRRFAPSIFAQEAHDSRSERYTYIPTIEVLNRLRGEGFQPFMVAQTRVRSEDKRDHTKHMIRLRHPSLIAAKEANEIILLNSHDGTSSYQMMAGCFRFVCANGLVCGDKSADYRVRHSGDVVANVIEGAYEVLQNFEEVSEAREAMASQLLSQDEQFALARGALAYRYDTELAPAPVTETQLLMPRRNEDRHADLWTTYNRIQENVIKGGLVGRNVKGQRSKTRAVTGLDQDLKLNRALWVMAQSLRQG
ncbi:TPA: DUF932 domain-containing protein [Pseudomonas putida]